MPLFENEDLTAPLTPGRELEREARRAQWRARQYRCRKLKRMTPDERAAFKAAEQLQKQAVELAKTRDQRTLGDAPPAAERDIFKALPAEWFLLKCMFLGGSIAARVFEVADVADFTQSAHRLMFDAGKQINSRGHVVTAAAIRAQLRADGILVFFDVEAIERHLANFKTVGVDEIDTHANELKRA